MTVSDLAAEYGVNRKTIRRPLDAAELAEPSAHGARPPGAPPRSG